MHLMWLYLIRATQIIRDELREARAHNCAGDSCKFKKSLQHNKSSLFTLEGVEVMQLVCLLYGIHTSYHIKSKYVGVIYASYPINRKYGLGFIS